MFCFTERERGREENFFVLLEVGEKKRPRRENTKYVQGKKRTNNGDGTFLLAVRKLGMTLKPLQLRLLKTRNIDTIPYL